MLGYGFPEEDYRRGLERQPDAVILDSGSTDPGPYMLGTGTTTVKPRAYVRDLKVILERIGDKKIPLLIGSAGGAGFDGNVDYIVDTISEVVAPTQELASAICSNARVALLHGPYPGQLATGGNLALPLNPPDNALGQVCRFSVYHLMDIDDPVALFPISVEEV